MTDYNIMTNRIYMKKELNVISYDYNHRIQQVYLILSTESY